MPSPGRRCSSTAASPPVERGIRGLAGASGAARRGVARPALRAVRGVRIRRPHLRVDLEPLPQALSRSRRLRADAGARTLHGRHGARCGARGTLRRTRAAAAARVCAGRDRHRRPGVPIPRRVRRRDRCGLRDLAAGRRRPGARRGDQVVACHRLLILPAVDSAGRDVPADERRTAAPASAASRRGARAALLLQQPRCSHRRAGERLRAHRTLRPPRHGAGRGRDQPRACRAGAAACAWPRSASRAGDPDRQRRDCGTALPSAPHRRAAHRDRIVHLRDRLDPHAVAGARLGDARVRTDALGIHPRHRVRRALGASSHRRHRRSGALPRGRAGGDGPGRAGDAAGLRPDVRSHAGRDPWHGEDRRGLRDLPRREPRHRAGGDVPRRLLRRHDAAADHLRAVPLAPRRTRHRHACTRSTPLGSIVGVVLAAHVLMPLLGLKGLVSTGATIDVALGLALLWRGAGTRALPAAATALAGAAFAAVLAGVALDPYRMASGRVPPRRSLRPAGGRAALLPRRQDDLGQHDAVPRRHLAAHQRQVRRRDQSRGRRAHLRRGHHGAHRRRAARAPAGREDRRGDRHRHRAHHAHAARLHGAGARRHHRDRAGDGRGIARCSRRAMPTSGPTRAAASPSTTPRPTSPPTTRATTSSSRSRRIRG